MAKPVILTGLRANNDLHIGNYFGSLLPIVNMARQHAHEFQINLFIPDLHSFTTPIDHTKLQKQINNNLRVFVAAGLPLTHENVYVYRQSYIPAHSELTWILDCFTGMGQLNRMTQFKDKSVSIGQQNISVGLFNYPVLMAADILLYGAQYIPVGDDQTQHIEFTRDVAERFNATFGADLLTVPYEVEKQHAFFKRASGLRIKDLVDPTKKMSKSSDSDKGVIFLHDSPDVAAKKIMSATTDSNEAIIYNPHEQPGVSNLLDLYELFGGQTADFLGQKQYGPFKSAVAKKAASFLEDFQRKLNEVDDEEIHRKLRISEEMMSIQANETLLLVQKAVGLRP